MALGGYLLSSVLMGIFLLVVGIAFAWFLPWERYTPSVETATGALTRAAYSPMTWVAAFIALVLLFGGGAIMFVSGEGGQEAMGMALAGLFLVLFSVFGFWGVYAATKSRGANSAQALGTSSFVFGLVFMTAVGIKLLLGL